jgi:hypothetical protein
MQINNILRQQLEEAHESNEALTADLQKLTSDWEVMREEMMVKEDEWKEEEQVTIICFDFTCHIFCLIFSKQYSRSHSLITKLFQ